MNLKNLMDTQKLLHPFNFFYRNFKQKMLSLFYKAFYEVPSRSQANPDELLIS